MQCQVQGSDTARTEPGPGYQAQPTGGEKQGEVSHSKDFKLKNCI